MQSRIILPSRLHPILALLLLLSLPIARAQQHEHVPASSIPKADLIQPGDFAASLKAGDKPVILQVGSHVMFAEAHITGAEYAGPAGQPSGLEVLKARLAMLPKDTSIVLYCGCCPWDRCPNIAPAYNLLHQQGFTHLKVLEIADNFGNDWVNKGYPTTKGAK